MTVPLHAMLLQTLCLTITSIYNLPVDDPGAQEPPASETRILPFGGNITNDAIGYTRDCPPGSYISLFKGRIKASQVAALGPFTCSGRRKTILRAVARSSGASFKHNGGNYTEIRVEASDSGITSIELVSPKGMAQYGASGGSRSAVLACPPGNMISGVYGSATKRRPITLGVICRPAGPEN